MNKLTRCTPLEVPRVPAIDPTLATSKAGASSASAQEHFCCCCACSSCHIIMSTRSSTNAETRVFNLQEKMHDATLSMGGSEHLRAPRAVPWGLEDTAAAMLGRMSLQDKQGSPMLP